MAITPLPPAPSPSDTQAQFNAKAFSFVAALPQFASEANATALAVDADAATATEQAEIATEQAAIATTKAAEASGSADAAALSAAAAATSATAAAASFDAFDDRYLGSKASDPTTDNDGNALITGALYWNTSANEMRVWNGSSWRAAVGSLVGNADTATKLQTPRTINGTSFDGSADITTVKWGAARTITIGNTGKSVDGSTNVSWSLAEIGAPARDGAGATGTWGISVSGNAATASKLQTARTITIGNTGKSFDGSANVSWSLGEIGATNDDGNYIVRDTRDVDTPTNLGAAGVKYEFKHNVIDGLNDGGTYHAVMTFQKWNDSSGGNTHQLGFTDNGNLWLRTAPIGGTWGPWRKFYHSDNLRDTVEVISTNTTAVASRTYVLTASLTLTLPANPTPGDWVNIVNRSGTTTPIVARNGQKIMGLAEDMLLDNANASLRLVFVDATRGWVLN